MKHLRCERGHNWKATIASRTAGTGCPYCAQRIQYRRKLI
ncbi:zinc-ribbon domain-containing protein [Colidextribacter sp. 210702-DFI.3.9]|nr:zinc-ribbon domain-containing protein [Colidextribacter sp. 210702-DFI.3.9]